MPEVELLQKLPLFRWHSRSHVGARRDKLTNAIVELAPKRVESILDVGCGDGTMTKAVADKLGAHVPTVTPPILRKMVWNPRTIETINEFNTAWRNRPKKK